MTYFPEEVVEHIFDYLDTHRQRNTVALVCKTWFRVERLSRRKVFIGNCYALRPETLITRFPAVRSLNIKGKPHFADFNLVPQGWGGFADQWIEAVARGCPNLEKLHLKRMVVTDECLEHLALSFPNFKALTLVSCEGFSTDGLAAIATHCRYLRKLDLQENEIEEHGSQWLSCFPDSFTSLVSLNFACLKGEVNAGALERLVSRCNNLTSLRVNRSVTLKTLCKIVANAPQLVDLGTGSFTHYDHPTTFFRKLSKSFMKIKGLSGFWDATPHCLFAIHPICSNLTCLNLSYAPSIRSVDVIQMIHHAKKLQRLWILDSIEDEGLAIVASTCKELQELRVFPADPFSGNCTVTEQGLLSVSIGCPMLHSVLYFCQQMTNVALIDIAKNCPRFTRFRLCIMDPKKPDPVTLQPLDEGFGAIVKSCKDLKRLSLSGLLTDQVFLYIGMYAEKVEMLSLAFAGDSDDGMLYVLNGCKNLRKLEIRDSPFGNGALLKYVEKYESMRSLWMSSCDLTLGGCKILAASMPRLNVEVIKECDAAAMEENPDDNEIVDKMYVYRTLAGPRNDAPEFVSIL